MKKNFIIVITFVLFTALILSNVSNNTTSYQGSWEKKEAAYYNINEGSDVNSSYTNFYNANKNSAVNNFYKEYTIDDFQSSTEEIIPQSDAYGYDRNVIKIDNNQSYTFNINVTASGLYEIYFDYYFLTSSILTTEAEMTVNGSYQYEELRQLIFKASWAPTTTDFAIDRYGNEIAPSSNRVEKWYEMQPLQDGSLIHNEPMMIFLDSSSTNKLALTMKTGAVLIGKIHLKSTEELPTYNQYIQDYNNAQKADELVLVPTEYLASKSDLSVRVYSSSEPGTSRYDTTNRLLNCIYHDSWGKGGQTLTWEVDIKEAKLYNLSFKYYQSSLIDLPAHRTIAIDGVVPFQEFENYSFPYAKNWTNESVKNDQGLLYIYLTPGRHTISMSVSLDFYGYIIEELDRIMDEMTEMSLLIKYLTNGQTDEYRNWAITQYIPELPSELQRWMDEIQSLIDYGNTICTNSRGSSTYANMKLAINKLDKIAEDPDQIANDLNNFTDGTASTSQLLGNTITSLSSNPIGLEMIYLGSENVELPRPRANFFIRLWEEIKKFFISFFTKQYSVGEVGDDEIEVWVNRSRQYLEIMQQLADEEGLNVRFSIMPDEQKLVLANASGDLPDVAMGVSNWIPYDLAIRGVTTDLRQFEGYEELVANMTKGALIPYAYETGLYGIPETQDFWVLYYRTDIFDSLGITIPSTWEELVNLLPTLQSRGLNFYSPISAYTGLKPFVATLPLLYQYGGSLYSEDGMTTTLSSEEINNALKFMTNLFTIYNVPEEVPNFFNSFRFGTLPLGIANSVTYIQLSTAAPEIQGNWDIALHLGVESNGEILRYSSTGSQGITMFESSDKKDQAWEFINWWMSTEVQERFISTLYSMYGLEYLWFTANNEAFESLPISTAHKEVIKGQWEWAAEASRIPATYMTERVISDAWSQVVYNGVNPRIALDDAAITANREIERKMTEFGYMRDGVKIKDYIVPTIYNIDNWLTKKGE